MSEEVLEDFHRAARLIKNASFVLVMSGAGFSADSGLKTYEDMDGIGD